MEKKTWMEAHKRIKEAFEDQPQGEFPYPIDTEDKQGELEFYDGGYSTEDAFYMAGDMLLDGIGTVGFNILDKASQAEAEGNKTTVQGLQDAAKEFLEEAFQGEDEFIKESSPEDLKKGIDYFLRQVSKWVDDIF